AIRIKHLRSSGDHMVFESWVAGAIFTLDVVKGIPRFTCAHIFMDCQVAIIALSAPKAQPGQYLLAIFHSIL
ncbi:hypothetical protein B0H10DRAFT_1631924, partial [Mycena sp. CBHHK59/15]